ncbi:MAG: hypothetical protein R2845_15625 [Thermomicrobiales bacterium]
MVRSPSRLGLQPARGRDLASSLAPPHPRFNTQLIEWVGWRTSWLILGLVMIAGLMPIAAILVRDRPEAIGQVLDGHVSAEDRGPAIIADASVDWTLKEASRTRVFWILLIGGTAIGEWHRHEPALHVDHR